jgi:hypothetical protein
LDHALANVDFETGRSSLSTRKAGLTVTPTPVGWRTTGLIIGETGLLSIRTGGLEVASVLTNLTTQPYFTTK